MYLSLSIILVVGIVLYSIGHSKGYEKGLMYGRAIVRDQLLERGMIGEDDTFWW